MRYVSSGNGLVEEHKLGPDSPRLWVPKIPIEVSWPFTMISLGSQGVWTNWLGFDDSESQKSLSFCRKVRTEDSIAMQIFTDKLKKLFSHLWSKCLALLGFLELIPMNVCWGSNSTKKQFSLTPVGVLPFKSILALYTQRQHPIPQVKHSILQDYFPILLGHQLQAQVLANQLQIRGSYNPFLGLQMASDKSKLSPVLHKLRQPYPWFNLFARVTHKTHGNILLSR